jgi:hypothetical protein
MAETPVNPAGTEVAPYPFVAPSDDGSVGFESHAVAVAAADRAGIETCRNVGLAIGIISPRDDPFAKRTGSGGA